MPVNVVKTPEQERLWNKAKDQAEKEGKANNWAYIMGVFKHMGGLDKTAGFIGNVLGKNVGEAKGAVNAFSDTMRHTKETIGKMNENKGFFGKHIADRQARKAMKDDYGTLRGLKNAVKDEEGRTFRARVLGSLGGGTAAAYGGNKLMENRNTGNNDELKPQYLASKKEELIEKIAESIVKEAAIADTLRNLRDTALLRRIRPAAASLDALKTNKRNVSAETDRLLDLKNRITQLEDRNKKLSVIRDRFANPPTNKARKRPGAPNFNPFDEAMDNAIRKGPVGKSNWSNRSPINFASRRDPKFRSQNAKRYADTIAENNKLLEAANKNFSEGYQGIQDVNDREYQKVFGLYGGGIAATGYGIHKLRKKKT